MVVVVGRSAAVVVVTVGSETARVGYIVVAVVVEGVRECEISSTIFRARILQERWICTIVCFPAHAKEHPVPLRGTPGFLWA